MNLLCHDLTRYMKTDLTAKYNIKNELLDRDNNQTRYIIQTIKIIARNKKNDIINYMEKKTLLGNCYTYSLD